MLYIIKIQQPLPTTTHMKRGHEAERGVVRPEKRLRGGPSLPVELWTCILGFTPPIYHLAAQRTCRLLRGAVELASSSSTQKHPTLKDVIVAPLTYVQWAYEAGCICQPTDAACIAAHNGWVEKLTWLSGPYKHLLSNWDVLLTAVGGGHMEVLKLFEEGVVQHLYTPNLCAGAASGGHLPAIQWLRAQGAVLNGATVLAAARGGYLEIVQWAYLHGCPLELRAMNAAVRHGHLKVAQWLRRRGCHWNDSTCAEAVLNGQLRVLRWLRSQYPPCPLADDTCELAAKRGHIHILEYARSLIPPCPWNEHVCYEAVKGGHVETLVWLRGQDPPCPWDKEGCRLLAPKRFREGFPF